MLAFLAQDLLDRVQENLSDSRTGYKTKYEFKTRMEEHIKETQELLNLLQEELKEGLELL